jgi:hypothetical protein
MKPKIIVYIGLAVIMMIVSFKSCEKIKNNIKSREAPVLQTV